MPCPFLKQQQTEQFKKPSSKNQQPKKEKFGNTQVVNFTLKIYQALFGCLVIIAFFTLGWTYIAKKDRSFPKPPLWISAIGEFILLSAFYGTPLLVFGLSAIPAFISATSQ